MRSILVVLTTTTDPLLQYEDYYEQTLYHVFVMSDFHLILQVTQTFRPDLLVLPKATHAFAPCFHQQPGLADVPVCLLTESQSDAVRGCFSLEPPDLQILLPLLQ